MLSQLNEIALADAKDAASITDNNVAMAKACPRDCCVQYCEHSCFHMLQHVAHEVD